jgi:hypothetical protein
MPDIVPPAPCFTSLLTATQTICKIVPGRCSGIEQRGNKFVLLILMSTNGLAGTAW